MRKQYFIKNPDGSITDTFNMDAHRERYGVTKTVVKATCGAAKFAMARIPGPHIVSEPVEINRKMICNGCPQQMHGNTRREKCRKCGCYLREKRKLKSETCPLALW